MKITKEQIYTIEKGARRNIDIEMGVPHFTNKRHKTAKDYNRQKYKRFDGD